MPRPLDEGAASPRSARTSASSPGAGGPPGTTRAGPMVSPSTGQYTIRSGASSEPARSSRRATTSASLSAPESRDTKSKTASPSAARRRSSATSPPAPRRR